MLPDLPGGSEYVRLWAVRGGRTVLPRQSRNNKYVPPPGAAVSMPHPRGANLRADKRRNVARSHPMQRAYHFESRFEASGFSQGITWMVQRLILLNVLVFAAQLLLYVFWGGRPTAPPPGSTMVTIWLEFHFPHFLQGWVWQPITYMFLHGGLLHLFLNMLWLYVFGPDVERVLGTRQFLWFYLICGGAGVFAEGVHYLMDGDIPPVVGASGAVLGVLIAFAYLYPNRQLFLLPLPIPINARAIVLFVVIMNLLSAQAMWARDANGGIAVATHFGGMGVGLAYMALAPRIRRLSLRRGRTARASRPEHDKVGDAVDNIFRFDDKRRRM